MMTGVCITYFLQGKGKKEDKPKKAEAKKPEKKEKKEEEPMMEEPVGNMRAENWVLNC